MYFTEGQLREYEHVMQEKPGHDRGPIETLEERECKQCLQSDEHCYKCGKEKCLLLKD